MTIKIRGHILCNFPHLCHFNQYCINYGILLQNKPGQPRTNRENGNFLSNKSVLF